MLVPKDYTRVMIITVAFNYVSGTKCLTLMVAIGKSYGGWNDNFTDEKAETYRDNLIHEHETTTW